ncbi:heterokaryon incompatibility, partial [Bimuria novae-zelandiae CBS 107.79]
YTCLSYVWGPEDQGHTILINDKPYKVRRNLFEFLGVARTMHHSKWLWIDALCINQASITECNHQVQQMGLIYSNAVEVLSWL